ncbi:hypothetical protein OKW27_003993 [Paraburkholderia sp. 35.1]
MDGFFALIIDLVKANGLTHASIHQQRKLLTLPGFSGQPSCGIR